MPTYEHLCPDDGRFETDTRRSSCPDCGQPARRIWTVPGITFTGSGFYTTDNR